MINIDMTISHRRPSACPSPCVPRRLRAAPGDHSVLQPAGDHRRCRRGASRAPVRGTVARMPSVTGGAFPGSSAWSPPI